MKFLRLTKNRVGLYHTMSFSILPHHAVATLQSLQNFPFQLQSAMLYDLRPPYWITTRYDLISSREIKLYTAKKSIALWFQLDCMNCPLWLRYDRDVLRNGVLGHRS